MEGSTPFIYFLTTKTAQKVQCDTYNKVDIISQLTSSFVSLTMKFQIINKTILFVDVPQMREHPDVQGEMASADVRRGQMCGTHFRHHTEEGVPLLLYH